MNHRFHGNHTIGDIVSHFPASSELFQANKIDFCCGGDRPLIAVLKEHQLEEIPFINNLNQLYHEALQKGIDHERNWLETTSVEIIDHVIQSHHAYLMKELPMLSELVIKILRVHGAHHRELSQVHQLFHMMKMAFEQHLIAEEQRVFPYIKQFEQQPEQDLLKQIEANINELEAEHDEVGNYLKELRAVTKDYALPADACRTYEMTYEKLEHLEFDTFQHVHLENNILFPRYS